MGQILLAIFLCVKGLSCGFRDIFYFLIYFDNTIQLNLYIYINKLDDLPSQKISTKQKRLKTCTFIISRKYSNYSMLFYLPKEFKLQNIMNQENQQFQIFAQDHSGSPEDVYFDEVVGALQDIMLDEAFDDIQNNFMKKYCSTFEDSQQNKSEYMEIFNLYQHDIEKFVEESLHKKLETFDMAKFVGLLEKRHDQIDEQIFDIIESFTSFETFKRIMLENKLYLLDQQNLKGLTIKNKHPK